MVEPIKPNTARAVELAKILREKMPHEYVDVREFKDNASVYFDGRLSDPSVKIIFKDDGLVELRIGYAPPVEIVYSPHKMVDFIQHILSRQYVIPNESHSYIPYAKDYKSIVNILSENINRFEGADIALKNVILVERIIRGGLDDAGIYINTLIHSSDTIEYKMCVPTPNYIFIEITYKGILKFSVSNLGINVSPLVILGYVPTGDMCFKIDGTPTKLDVIKGIRALIGLDMIEELIELSPKYQAIYGGV